jgi:hypothetical protein
MLSPQGPIESFDAAFFAFADERARAGIKAYNPVDVDKCALAQFVSTRGYQGGSRHYSPWNGTGWFPYPALSYVAAVGYDSTRRLFGDHDGATWADVRFRMELLLSDPHVASQAYEYHNGIMAV